MEMGYLLKEKFEFGQNERFELIAYSIFLFAFALILGSVPGLPAQFFVGTVVNAVLVLSAFYLSGWKSVFPMILPSIAAYLSGIVFGASSIFLLYFIPLIWLGNFVYVALVKKFAVSENQAGKGMLVASAAKAGLLFICAIALVGLGIVPQMFLIAMGPMQFATAICGGAIGTWANILRKNRTFG